MDTITLKALADFPAQLEAHYSAIPANHKNWKPASWEGIPSEHLTAIEQLCHVRDVEIDGYQIRIQRTLKEENPFLPGLDTDGLARDREYHKQDAAQVLAEFRDARAKTLSMLKALSPQQLTRRAEFEDYGQTTPIGLAHYLCSHDQQHLAGLQWLAGKLGSAAT
jgi:DinB family protein